MQSELNRPQDAGPIMLVDDDRHVLNSLKATLMSLGYSQVVCLDDPLKVLDAIDQQMPMLALIDQSMPQLTGDQLLQQIKRQYPQLPVMMITAVHDVSVVIQCMRQGACDYLIKPIQRDELAVALERALHRTALEYQCRAFSRRYFDHQPSRPESFAHILTQNERMLRIFTYIEAIAGSDQPVLITGETGTGKELIARAIHLASGRSGELVAVNVAGLDGTMFADTLFGHVKGAFTDARQDRFGLVQQAAGGTLLLDEIGDLDEAGQIKLLRLIQQRQYHRLGEDAPRPTDARILTATSQPAEQLREDLYYRINAFHIHLPPLRERLDDLPILLDYFVSRVAADLGRPVPAIDPDLISQLQQYSFPGNVREFEGLVHHAMAVCRGSTLDLQCFIDRLPDHAAKPVDGRPTPAGRIAFPSQMPTMDHIREQALAEALRRCDDNRTAAASMLNVSRSTVKRFVADGVEQDQND